MAKIGYVSLSCAMLHEVAYYRPTKYLSWTLFKRLPSTLVCMKTAIWSKPCITSHSRVVPVHSFIIRLFVKICKTPPADTAATGGYKKFKKYTYMSIAKTSEDQLVSCPIVDGWKYEDVLRWSMAGRTH